MDIQIAPPQLFNFNFSPAAQQEEKESNSPLRGKGASERELNGSFRGIDQLRFNLFPCSEQGGAFDNSLSLRSIMSGFNADPTITELVGSVLTSSSHTQSTQTRNSPFQVTTTRSPSRGTKVNASAATAAASAGDLQSPFGRSPPNHARSSSPMFHPNSDLSEALREASNQEEARKIYEKVMERWLELCKEFPSLRRDGSLEIFYPEERILGIDGVKIMLHELSQAFGEPLPCFACSDLESFKRLLKVMDESSFRGKAAFIVRSLQFESMNTRASHVTAVLIERSDEETKILIADSIGAEEGGGRIYPRGNTSKAKEEYKFFLEQATKKNDPIYQKSALMNLYMMIQAAAVDNTKIMFVAPKRQRADTGCSIFSLHDVNCFFRNSEFFKEVERYNPMKADPEDSNLYSVSWLPPENMELTQSITQLKRYAQTSPLDRPGWNVADLLETCRPATPITPGDPKNTNAEDLKYKFLDQICSVVESNVNEVERKASLFDDQAARKFFKEKKEIQNQK